jgi:hypothetical protein
MNQSLIAFALMLTVGAINAVAATSDSDMLHCAAIAARDARLDCYDGLAHQLSGKATAPGAVPTAAASAATPAATPTTTPTAPVASAAADPKNFGLSAAQQHTVDIGPQVITATISILSSDQKGDTLMVLDNGQTWSVAANDGWLATGQAVRIKKAAMGSYLMLIPSNHSYHVRRLK